MEQAETYVASFMVASEGLASGEKVGRSVDIREGYKKYPVGSHLIFFMQTKDIIDVVRVLHQRMDTSRHLTQTP